MSETATPTPAANVLGPQLYGPVRIAFPWLSKVRPNKPGDTKIEKYGAVVLIPKTETALVERARAAIKAAFLSKFGDAAKLSKDKQPMKDGDAPEFEDDDAPGKFPGYMYFNVGAYPEHPPVLKHADKSPMTNPAALSSGDWAYVSVKARAYAFENTKGVSFDILGLRMVKKGDPIVGSGGVVKAEVESALDSLDIPVDAMGDDDEAF